MSPLLKKKRVLAGKVEATVGTAESLGNSDGIANAYNVEIQPTITPYLRPRQGGFSPLPAIPGARGGRLTFSVDLLGGSSDPFWATVFLPGCGWVASTGTYSPRTEAPGSNVKTLTLGVYEDGLLKSIKGAAGTAVINFISGIPVRADFTFLGCWVEPVDSSPLTPTYETALPPRFASSTVTIGSYTPKISSMTIDLGNTVELRADATQESAYHSALITDRTITGTLDPESELVGTEDSYGKWLSSTQAALALVIGSSGNRITIGAPKLQYTNLQEADRNLLQIDNITFQLNGSSSAGNDDLTFAFD